MTSLIPYRYRSIGSRPDNGFWGDEFFRNFFGTDSMNTFRVDVVDNGDSYLMEAELPGMTREQVHVDVDDGVLTITCDVNEDRKDDKREYVISERRSGRMQRAFTLNQIRESEISAEYKDGVLRLTLPKAGEAASASRRIDIR